MNRRYLIALAAGALLLGAGAARAADAAAKAAPSSGAAATPAAAAVNVNTATLQELEALPGIGEARAQAILDARKQRGGFKSVDELVDVRGIGPKNLEKLRPYLHVSGKTGVAGE
jgi:competence protein ComEA